MATLELIISGSGGPGQRYPVPVEGLYIGRHESNDIVLDDQRVSRRHARVWRDGESLHVQDLGSSNGILVNGVRVENALLREEDELQVGGTRFRMHRSTGSNFGQTVIEPQQAATLYADITASSGEDARLPVLYEAAQLLAEVFDLDKLLQAVLDLSFRHLPVRRGYIILREENGAWRVHAERLDDAEAHDALPLSHTLIQHVLDREEAVLTVDAQEDERFSAALSIASHHIRGAICVPLMGRREAVGALYVDSGQAAGAYTQEDLELLTALGRVLGVAVENARLHAALVQAERLSALGEATAGFGHCMKNILGAIQGGGELTRRALNRSDCERAGEGLSLVVRAADRLEMIMLNMLSFAREDAPERKPTDLAVLAREAAEMMAARAEAAELEIEVRAPETLVCMIDGLAVQRVLLNLIANAIEAAHEHGSCIEVTCRQEERGCAICVQDDGPGIDPRIQDRLFEPFATTKGSGGTGLGLACCKKLVEAQGGSITVDSAPGEGACFTVYLPADAADRDAPTQRPCRG